jgi:FkbM family methyltransferase
MRLTGVATVKNESDIIESFVRYNLGFLDRLHVVDNGSTDTTGALLAELARELPALTVEFDPYPGHVQEGKVAAVARTLAAQEPFDFLFPIDADEFFHCHSRAALESALAKLPARTCGAMPWVTYVPTAADLAEEPDPLRRIGHRRAREPEPRFFKLAVPGSLVAERDFSLWPGNHAVCAGGASRVPQVAVDGVEIAHYPVRSSAQLASKVLLGEWALRTKPGRMRGEGWHWQALAAEIERDPRIPDTRLAEVAAAYAADASAELVRDPLALPPAHRLTMPERIEVDLLKRVVSFAGRHFAEHAHTIYANPYMAIARTQAGPLAYPRADLVIGRSLGMYGEWAEKEIQLLLALLRPGDNAVDVGACIGTHAVRFAQRVGPAGTVYALEPQRSVYQLLCANAALNQLTNIHALHAAAGDAEGHVQIPADDPWRPRNVGNFSVDAGNGVTQVKQVTLDSLALPAVRLIKVDVEGMEERVLRGAARLIARDRPALFVENNIPERSESLLRAIGGAGYMAWWHFESYYNANNYYRNPTNFLASVPRPEINILALPPGSEATHPALVPVRGTAQTWEEAYAELAQRT